jgi:DNA-binding response OmpR family regulator
MGAQTARRKATVSVNIAILEDRPAMVELLTTFLRLEGYQVQVYEDGRILLRAVAASGNTQQIGCIDLVILTDTITGSLTAYEVILALRQHSTLPILVLSGSLEQEVFLRTHVPDLLLLCTPFPIKELLALVKASERSA